MNIHNLLWRQHGREIVRKLRSLEKTAEKLARWCNHRVLNLRCRHNNLMPKSVRLNSNVNGSKATQILHKAEVGLLNIRISQCKFTIEKLKTEKLQIERELYDILEPEVADRCRQFIAHAQEHIYVQAKEKQKCKYEGLIKAQSVEGPGRVSKIDRTRWVANHSKYKLSDTETQVLSKGLNFAVTPTSWPIKNIITATEVACNMMDDPTKKAKLRSEVVGAVRSAKTPIIYIGKGSLERARQE